MSSQDMPDMIEVFTAPGRAQCDDRAFMLSAVNIPSVVEAVLGGYVVRVPHAQAAFATHHLWQYEQELRSRPRVVSAEISPYPHAWVGSALYVAILVLAAMSVVRGWGPLDMFSLGTLDAAAVQAGQWWRAFTALTLHVDIVHLMMNLGAGTVIGFLASRQMGGGTAWLLTVLGAGVANFTEALASVAGHQSVGASTAVFAALGLLAAHSWRTYGVLAKTSLRRRAPIIAGVALLGFLGTAGEGTNLVAHLFGFAYGAVLGILAAQPGFTRLFARIPQWASGVIALGIVGSSWILSLSR
jgi:membrane associated rhomboid family serine protease